MGKQGAFRETGVAYKSTILPGNRHNIYSGVCDVPIRPWKLIVNFLEKGIMWETYSELLILQNNSMSNDLRAPPKYRNEHFT